jgi:tRNA A-37 threonylcarbamoyl transferase component Bud32
MDYAKKILPKDLIKDLIKDIHIDEKNRIYKRIKRGYKRTDRAGNPKFREEIEITPEKNFEEEFDIQQDIYNKTYDPKSVSKYDAICPRPIHKEIKPIRKINKVIESLQNKEHLDEINRLFNEVTGNNVHQVGLIYMEMMDGWNIVYDVLYKNPDISDERKQFFKNMFRYEIDRLHKIGYAHLDPHHENAMVNLQYPYLTNTNNNFIGRVILIDFGRSKKLLNDSDKEQTYKTKDIQILQKFSIDYSGFILDKEANYKNINQLRINFNKERNKNRKIDPRLEFYINKQIISEPPGWLQRTSLAISRIPSFFTRKMMPLYQTQQHLCPNPQPPPEIVAEQTISDVTPLSKIVAEQTSVRTSRTPRTLRTPQTPLPEIVAEQISARTSQTPLAEPVLDIDVLSQDKMEQKPQYSARTPLSKIVVEQTYARTSRTPRTSLAETVLDKQNIDVDKQNIDVPSLYKMEQKPQYSARTPRHSARTQRYSARTPRSTPLTIVQYFGGRQTNKYARVNTRKKRRRQKVSAKHNSISRRSTRKKR